MGEETDGVVESVSKLQEKVMAISGVNILDDTGAYRDTYEILKDLAGVWDEIGQSDPKGQAALLELLAGKNRSNALAAILTNLDDIKDAYDAALNAEGSASRELETYMNSIEGRISVFTNSVQTMWMNAINTDDIKWFVDAGTKIIEFLDGMVKAIGPIPTLITLVATAIGAWKGLPKLFANLFLKIKGTADATEEDTNAKLKNEIQSAKLSKKVKQEALGRVYSKETIEAETAALNENTEAKIRNEMADKGDVDIPNVDVDGDINFGKVTSKVDDVADNIDIHGYDVDAILDWNDAAASIDNFTDSSKVAKEVVGEVAEEALEAGVEIAAAGAATKVAGAGAEAAVGGIGKAVSGLAGIGAKIGAFLTSPLGIALGVITLVTIAVDVFTTSFKEAKKELEETTEELNNVRLELEAVNNELETTSSRIEELEGKGKLSFVEEQELKKLKEQNAELERQQKILEATEKRKHKNQIDAAMQTMSKDKNLQDQLAANGTGNASINVGNKFETTLNSLEGAYREVDRLKKLQNRALEVHGADSKEFKDLEKQVKNAEKKVEDLNASYDEMASDWEENYGHIGYIENATEDWEKEWNQQVREYQDNQLRQSIINGDITAGDALGSVFSSKGTEAAQKFSEAFTNKINSNEFESLEEALSYVNDALKLDTDLAEQLDYIGIKAEDVAGYFMDLNEAVSDSTVANQKLARSQKRLEYYKLYKQLNQYTKRLADGRRRTRELSAADKEATDAIRKKMSALASEISAYDILGKQIEEAKAAFDEFENAKTADSESDRLESAGEMFKAIIDGFHSAELGSETFKAAMAGLVPESVYKDLDTLEEKYDAIWKYMNEDLNKYFTLEYDDDGLLTSVETTTADVERFIQDAKDKGLMSFADGIWTVNETDFSKFAESMGITESALYALAVQMDKIDADWIMGDISTFLESFDMGTESNIYKTITSLADLDQQLIDGKITLEEYTKKYNEYQDALKQESSNALDEVVKYNEASAKVDEYTEKVSEARKELEGLISSGASAVEINQATDRVSKLTSDLGRAIQAKCELTAPSEMLITFAQDSLIAEMEALKAQWATQHVEIPLVLNTGEINSDLITKDLETGKYTVAVTPEVQGLTNEDRATLQSYADLLNAEETINIFIEGEEDAKAKLEAVETEAEAVEKAIEAIPDPEISTTQAINAIKDLKRQIESIKDKTITITTIYETIGGDSGGNSSGSNSSYKDWNYSSYSSRPARAGGSSGLKTSEYNALVGELGTETVVDPHKGIYYTVGDNGAEFVDLPKDAIIFNHKQTEELFKNGHINSRGKAYASGNAYVGTSGTIFDKYINNNAFGDRGSGLNDSAVADTLSDIDDDFKELFDWFEILVEEIDEQISLMEAQLENAVGVNSKKNIYSGLISAEYAKLDAFTQGIELYTKQAEKFLAEIPAKYKEMAKDGSVQITAFTGEANEKVVEAINNYREWAQKVADLNLQLEESKSHISDLRVETQDMISTEYENKIGLIANLNDTLEAEIGLLEESGQRISTNFYTEMIKNGETQLKLLQEKRNAMQSELDSAVKSGDVTKYSDDWYEMVNAIYEVDAAVIDCETNIEGFNNSIQELHWENFEKIIDEIAAVSDEAEQLRDLIDDTDITEKLDPEQWSKDGLTALGLVAQQMENAQYRSELYAKEIEYLNKEFKAGNYTQDEYNEKLKELKDGQWDAIDAYESAKDAIVDLNKTRVEAIKDGIQKEIDAYEELINKRKEDLDSQKDAHDWANTVADHTKNIDDIQRQIDAMEGDSSAAAAAARKKLQEELKVAQEEYDEALYDRSIETQQKSLDKSLETYREEQEAKMEELDAWLENEEMVIAESYAIISANTEAIHSNIEAISDKYGIEIENNVVDPWTAGITALGTYGTELDTATSKYVEMLGRVRQELVDLQLQADNTAASIIKTTNANAEKTQAAVKDKPKETPKSTTTTTPKKTYSGGYGGGYSSSVSVGGTVTVKDSATNFSKDGGNGTNMQSWVPGSSFTVMETSGNQVLIGIPGKGYTGWVDKKDLVGYAKGTTGVKSNQLAWIDENGLEEIVMHAQGGKLTYLTKGSAVIPNPLVDNIMEWGEIDPKTWLANNRKTTTPVSLTTNNNVIDIQFGSLINIEHADRDSIPEIQDVVKKQLDAFMKNINTGLKKYTR